MRLARPRARLKTRSLTVDDVNAAIREAEQCGSRQGAQASNRRPRHQLGSPITTLGRADRPGQFGDIIVSSAVQRTGAVRARVTIARRDRPHDYSTVARFSQPKQAAIAADPAPSCPARDPSSGGAFADRTTMHRRWKDFPLPVEDEAFFRQTRSMPSAPALAESQQDAHRGRSSRVFLVVAQSSSRVSARPSSRQLHDPTSRSSAPSWSAAVRRLAMNTLTMFGLVAVGIVVDAIIVVENVRRFVASKLPRKAAIRDKGEIAGAGHRRRSSSWRCSPAALGGLTGRIMPVRARRSPQAPGSRPSARDAQPAAYALIPQAHGHDRPPGPVAAEPGPGARSTGRSTATRVYAWTAHLFVRAWPLAALGLVGVLGPLTACWTRACPGLRARQGTWASSSSQQVARRRVAQRSDELIARVASRSWSRRREGRRRSRDFSIVIGQGSAYANAWSCSSPGTCASQS